MGKALKSVASIAAPLIGNAIAPGFGGVIGGALGGAASGGGLKGALGGALTGAGAGFGGQIASAFGAPVTATNAALGAIAPGVAGGALSGGGLKGAVQGAATAGLGAYTGAGGFDDTWLGRNVIGSSVPSDGSMGPVQPGGIRGMLSGDGIRGTDSGSSSLSGLGPLASALSATQSYLAQDDIEKYLRNQQLRAEGALTPFQNPEFKPGDLTQDPGYQFNLAEGQKAIDRANAARGNYYSGAALKEATEFGQGLADRTYNDAYKRWMGEQQQGLDAASRMTGVYDNLGNIGANAEIGRSNAFSKGLSGLTGSGTRTIIGYNPNTGQPIYSDEV